MRTLAVGTLARARVGIAVAALGGLAVAAAPARALPVTLQDGSAVVTIDPGSPDGVSGWSVNGIPHVRTQWFWVRVGDAGPETSIDALRETARAASDADADGRADALLLALADPAARFALELRWSLAGTPFAPIPTASASELVLQLLLTNTSGGPLEIALFQYTDVDLFNTFVDDSALWSGGPGGPDAALVTDATGLAEWESVFTPRPTAVEASLHDAALASLLDGDPTTPTGALAAAGDVTVTAAWRVVLDAGGSLLLRQDQRIRVAPIPEPSLALLVAGGLAILSASRRRRTSLREGGR
jgi:hypothetical protein